MIRHIVLFKLKKNLTAAQKAAVTKQFKAAIETLPSEIDYIRKVTVQPNLNPDEDWDICLDSLFDTLDDVRRYSAHPSHIKAASLLKEAKDSRACVDTEI